MIIQPGASYFHAPTGKTFENQTSKPLNLGRIISGETVYDLSSSSTPPLPPPPAVTPPPPLPPAPPWIPIPPPARSVFKFTKPLPDGPPTKTVKFIEDSTGRIVGAEVFEATKADTNSVKT